MSDTNGRMTEFVANHPRKIGVLFALLVTISQVGSAAATTTATTFV